MTTQSAPSEAPNSSPEAPHPGATADQDLTVRSLAEFVATTLSGMHGVNGQFLCVKASVGDDGYIDVEVVRVSFSGEDVTVRVLLHPTAPVPASRHTVPMPRPRSEPPSSG
jgi:hypothetical protein